MKLTIEMPWEKNLSINHMRFGKGGGYRKKPEVQGWIESLKLRTWFCQGGGYHMAHQMAPLPRPPIRVTVDFRFPDKRKRDTHNYFKILCLRRD